MSSNVFGDLQMLRERPIPVQDVELGAARGYRATPIDKRDPAFDEPLLEASRFGLAGENFYAGQRNPPYYHAIPGAIQQLLLRKGVGARLATINEQLAHAGLELWLFDAWRPQAVQTYFHDHWFPAEVRRRNPGISEDALLAEVETYWAAPSAGADAPSPHATGAAVDLTVRWRGGDALWMGSLFDDAAPIAHTARFEITNDDALCFSDAEARANRRLLYWLMRDAGFAANPSEWWHFSFGDQMWAKLTGAPYAIYGATAPA